MTIRNLGVGVGWEGRGKPGVEAHLREEQNVGLLLLRVLSKGLEVLGELVGAVVELTDCDAQVRI